MKLQVIFDKLALNKKLQIGWGVSFLIDNRILFDTGEKGPWLFQNMQVLGIDPLGIESVVISHDHWDHTGGLWDILSKNSIKVYACPGFSKSFLAKVKEKNAELIEVDRPVEISHNIFITGEIPGAYNGRYMPEQAMVLKTVNGLTIITGCAHPGIVKMIDRIKVKFPDEPLYLVMGGFHLKDIDKRGVEIIVEKFKKAGVAKAGPTHCSGSKAEDIFKRLYGKDFISVRVGQEIEV
jgi:7,8-dihydropterin-6-yl-methyl-4-(beta-D-ribofuranosyl)aminobenzene 5'-phosphate synthase